MIIGIGTDIVKIDRLNNNVINNVLTKEEIIIYDKKIGKKKNEFYAGRFAAKESIIKALTNYENPHMLELNILNENSGKPIINYKDYLIDISISHENDYAIAFVIVKKR